MLGPLAVLLALQVTNVNSTELILQYNAVQEAMRQPEARSVTIVQKDTTVHLREWKLRLPVLLDS